MSKIKKILPYFLVLGIGAGTMYFIKPRLKDAGEFLNQTVNDLKLSEVKLSESENPIQVYCPQQEEALCPPIAECKAKTIVKWKTVYKDRIVYVPKKLKPGCVADWKTGLITGTTVNGLALECLYDSQARTIKERFWEPVWVKTQREALNKITQELNPQQTRH